MPDQLSHHLDYELWMLQQTLLRLGNPPLDIVVCNALIESFCIHARATIEFLDDPKRDKARLYVQKASYAPFSGTKKVKKRAVARLNKQIAHLDKDGRHITSVGKIDVPELIGLYDLIRLEYRVFKSCLQPKFVSIAPQEPPSLALTSAPPTATNAIVSMGSTTTTTSSPVGVTFVQKPSP